MYEYDFERNKEKVNFLFFKANDVEWCVGEEDRGMGRANYAVCCKWDYDEYLVEICKCPSYDIAKHIVDVHNTWLKNKVTAE